MKRAIIKNKTNIRINKSFEGETIEDKCRRIEEKNEPIEDTAPIIYRPREEGVRPEFDIRTDRFDYALDMADGITKNALAKREQLKVRKDETPSGDDQRA